MNLSYKDLQKRDVINIADGRCLGRIIDMQLSFPKGILTGIVVPGRRVFGFRLFDRTQIFIDESRIVKIGGDVILVNINCGDVCSPSTKPSKPCPPPKHCSPNACPPNPCAPHGNASGIDCRNLSCEEILEDCRIDKSDY